MTLFAVFYHVVPAAAQNALARIHLIVSLTGLILIVPGIAVVLSGGTDVLAKIGSVVSLASMLIFLAVALRSRKN